MWSGLCLNGTDHSMGLADGSPVGKQRQEEEAELWRDPAEQAGEGPGHMGSFAAGGGQEAVMVIRTGAESWCTCCRPGVTEGHVGSRRVAPAVREDGVSRGG